MKKRAMKKWIPHGDFCYTVTDTHIAENGMTVLTCDVCRNYIPQRENFPKCRYTDNLLMYGDLKECGHKHTASKEE